MFPSWAIRVTSSLTHLVCPPSATCARSDHCASSSGQVSRSLAADEPRGAGGCRHRASPTASTAVTRSDSGPDRPSSATMTSRSSRSIKGQPGTQTPTHLAGHSCNGGSTRPPCSAGSSRRSSSYPSPELRGPPDDFGPQPPCRHNPPDHRRLFARLQATPGGPPPGRAAGSDSSASAAGSHPDTRPSAEPPPDPSPHYGPGPAPQGRRPPQRP